MYSRPALSSTHAGLPEVWAVLFSFNLSNTGDEDDAVSAIIEILLLFNDILIGGRRLNCSYQYAFLTQVPHSQENIRFAETITMQILIGLFHVIVLGQCFISAPSI